MKYSLVHSTSPLGGIEPPAWGTAPGSDHWASGVVKCGETKSRCYLGADASRPCHTDVPVLVAHASWTRCCLICAYLGATCSVLSCLYEWVAYRMYVCPDKTAAHSVLFALSFFFIFSAVTSKCSISFHVTVMCIQWRWYFFNCISDINR